MSDPVPAPGRRPPATGRPAARPAGRYGDSRGPRRVPLLLAAVLGLALLVGFAGWVALHQGRQVSWQEIAFEVLDPGQVSLTFQLTRPADTPVTCIVAALNRGQNQVGRRDVEVPAGPEQTSQLDVRIRTSEPAVAARVVSCAATG